MIEFAKISRLLRARIESTLAFDIKPSWMVYPFKNKKLTEMPVSPKNTEKWHESVGEADQLPFANLDIGNDAIQEEAAREKS